MGTTNEPGLRLPGATDEPIEWDLGAEPLDRCALELFVGGEERIDDHRLPVAGRHHVDSGVLRFRPAFDLVAGQDYVVRTRRAGTPPRLTPFRIPHDAAVVPAQVTAVYPSGEVLPENVLRFYLHFSVPMAPGRAGDFVQLRDESGRVDPAVFMVFKQELWNTDRTRLTLLVDPGRIKKSIVNRGLVGPALVGGRCYTLTVSEGWPVADGGSTLPAFSKTFRVGPGLRHLSGTQRWRWSPPEPGCTDPFVISFDRPYDRHLVLDAIHITDGDGLAVDGTPMVGPGERSWSFTPAEPWPVDGLRVRVADHLEDVAGNSLRALVERELTPARPADAPPTARTTTPTVLRGGAPIHV